VGRFKYRLTAIAYRALQHGYEARFVSTDLLIEELSYAVALGTLDAATTPYLHPHVLVLDEIGYLRHAADVPYCLVNDQ
jgi:DNA replication protein DnaC